MNAIKTIYTDMPETVKIPKEFVHKRGEIIIIMDEDIPNDKNRFLKDFYGILPNFPERAEQGNYEKREVL